MLVDYAVTKGGGERVNLLQFLKALIEAEGIELDGKQTAPGRGGRIANYRLRVQGNGNLLISAAHTKQMGLQIGDEFAVVLGRKQIQLQQLDPAD